VEDQNFSLFNYVNELNNEIETLQEKACFQEIYFNNYFEYKAEFRLQAAKMTLRTSTVKEKLWTFNARMQ
jgi:hypothetical protein